MAESTKELTDEGAKVTTTVEGSDATAAAPAEPSGKKGYWIIHILPSTTREKFFAHLSLANSKTKYGGKTHLRAREGDAESDPVAYCAVIEFRSASGHRLLGRRGGLCRAENYWAIPRQRGRSRVCVIEADPLPELKPARASINHVHAVKDKSKFMPTREVDPAVLVGDDGPGRHQHVGAGATSYTVAFAARSGSVRPGRLDAGERCLPAARRRGMAEGDDDVVDRTVCGRV